MSKIISIIILLLPTVLYASDTNLEKVSLQLQWKHQFEFAGFYAAKEKGFYKDVGLDVELKEYEFGQNVTDIVLNNKATFGTSYSTVILDRMKGKPVTLLANYFKRSPLALATKPNIFSPTDLKGKKIMGGHVMVDALFKQMFNQFNMTEKDFTIVPENYNFDTFINGEVDACGIFLTNQPYLLQQKKIPHNIIDPNYFGVAFYDVNLFTSQEFASRNPETSKKFIEASNKGWQYALKHKEEIVELILKKYNTQNKSREHLMFEAMETERVIQPNMYPIGTIDKDRIDRIQNVFVQNDLAKTTIDSKTFIFDSAEYKPVVKLTPMEKEWLKNNPLITLTIPSLLEPVYFVENSEVKGIIPDLIKEIFSGIDHEYKFKPIGKEWSVLDGLTEETHGVATVIDVASYDHKLVHTDPYYETVLNVFVHKDDSNKITKKEDFAGKTISVMKNHKIMLHYLKGIEGVHVVPADSPKEQLELLQYKKVDIVIGYINYHSLINKYLLENVHFTFSSEKGLAVRIGLKKGHEILKGILDKAIASVPSVKKEEIYDKWIGKNLKAKSSKKIKLTDSQKNYLESKNNKLTYCFSHDFKPYDYLEDGEHKGHFSDYLKLFSERIGVAFEPVVIPAWPDSYNGAVEGKCDFYSALVKLPEYEKDFSFTKPYFSIKSVLLAKNDKPFVNSIVSLSDEPIGVGKGFSLTLKLKENYPDHQFVEYDPNDGLAVGVLRVLDSGKAYAAAIQLYEAARIVSESGGEYKIIALLDDDFSLSAAVPKDDLVLQGILDKAISTLSIDDKSNIEKRWNKIDITVQNKINYTLVFQVIGVALLLMFVSLYWIKKLKIANTKLIQEEQNYHTVFDSSIDSMYLYEIDTGKLVDVNNTAIEQMGFTKEELLSFDISFFSNETHKDSLALLQKATQEIIHYEKETQRKDGTVFYEELHFKQVYRDNKPYILVVSRDISESKFLEDQRNQLTFELKAINESLKHRVDEEVKKRIAAEQEHFRQEQIIAQKFKQAEMGQMMASIIHQWKQPLNTLSLYSSIISKKIDENNITVPVIKETSENIKEQVFFMSETMNNFRNFFNQNMQKTTFSPAETMENMKTMFKGIFEKNGIAIVIQVEKEFSLYENESDLMHVFLNLFNNSKEAMESNNSQEKVITCTIDRKNSTGIIRVKDTGGGVPKELLPDKIFESQFTTKGKQGTGLGLEICKNIIIDKMQGNIVAHNWAKGAEFQIGIPIVSKDEKIK